MSQRTAKLAGVAVTVSMPPGVAKGITFLLPGAMIAIREYNATRDVLLRNNQVILSFFSNVLTTSHRTMAQRVPNIFDDFIHEHNYNFTSYSIVGHSVGGKVALLVATAVDVDRVSTVVSLDPVDMRPPEFVSGNVSLSNSKASLHMTWATAGGSGITSSNNPLAIYQRDPNAVQTFTEFQDAGHLAYTDNGGGFASWLMRSGTKEGNAKAHAETLELVGRLIK